MKKREAKEQCCTIILLSTDASVCLSERYTVQENGKLVIDVLQRWKSELLERFRYR